MTRRIAAVVTNRASYARIKAGLLAIEAHPELELEIILGGAAVLPRFGRLGSVVASDGLRVTSHCYFSVEGDHPSIMAKSAGMAVIDLSQKFLELNPDCVITVADRYETLGTAIAASFMNIPLAHTQGGEITGSIDNKVRDAITMLADIHFPASRVAEERLVHELGVAESSVYRIGCPSIDLVKHSDLTFSPGLLEELDGVGESLNSDGPYIVVQHHPVTTNYGSSATKAEFEALFNAVSSVAREGIQVVWFWPNIDAGGGELAHQIRLARESQSGQNMRFVKNLPPEKFYRLVNNSLCLVGNSSIGIREGAFLGLPVVNIGERQNGRARALNVRDCGIAEQEIERAIRMQVASDRFSSSSIYGEGNAGTRMAEILARIPLHE